MSNTIKDKPSWLLLNKPERSTSVRHNTRFGRSCVELGGNVPCDLNTPYSASNKWSNLCVRSEGDARNRSDRRYNPPKRERAEGYHRPERHDAKATLGSLRSELRGGTIPAELSSEFRAGPRSPRRHPFRGGYWD